MAMHRFLSEISYQGVRLHRSKRVRFVEFQPEQGLIGFRWSPSNFLGIRDVSSKPAGFIRSLNGSEMSMLA